MSAVPLPGEGTYFEAGALIAGADTICVPRAMHVQQRWQDQAILVCAQLGTLQQCDAGVPRGIHAVPPDDSAWMCPWEGLLHTPSGSPAKPRLCTGTASLPQPLPCLDTHRTPVQPCWSCCSACYHVRVFLSWRMTQIFVPRTCLHSQGGRSVRERSWQHSGVWSLVCPPHVAGPATRSRACGGANKGQLLLLERELTGPLPSTGEPLGRDVPRLTWGSRGSPRCAVPKQVISGCFTPS